MMVTRTRKATGKTDQGGKAPPKRKKRATTAMMIKRKELEVARLEQKQKLAALREKIKTMKEES